MLKQCINCITLDMNNIKSACTQTILTLSILILKPATPSFSGIGDFTLQGTTDGAPDVDLNAPTDVAVAKDGELPIVEIDVSVITTRSDRLVDADHPQGNNESRKKNESQTGFARNSGILCKDIFHDGITHVNNFDHAYGSIMSMPKKNDSAR